MISLSSLPLFHGLTEEEIAAVCTELREQKILAPKGSVLIRQGETTERCGIVLQGRLYGEQINEDGDLSVITTLTEGMVFGEILMFSHTPAPITLIAAEESRVLWLGPLDLSRTNPIFLKNLLALIGEEYWALHKKIRYVGIVSLRKRIWAFLSDRSPGPGIPFTVPFDRNGMAAYLNVNRSALSRELSRMQNEGFLTYKKDKFSLFSPTNTTKP